MSCVYGLLNEPAGRIKIGMSVSLRDRIYELSRLEGVELTCLGAIAGGSIIERTLHREFDAFRLDGEWFSREEVLEKSLLHLFETKGSLGEKAIARFTPAKGNRTTKDIEGACVSKAGELFDALWQPDFQELKTTDAALKQAAGRIGIPPSLAWGFQYRQPKSISAGQFIQILAHSPLEEGEVCQVVLDLIDAARECGRASRRG